MWVSVFGKNVRPVLTLFGLGYHSAMFWPWHGHMDAIALAPTCWASIATACLYCCCDVFFLYFDCWAVEVSVSTWKSFWCILFNKAIVTCSRFQIHGWYIVDRMDPWNLNLFMLIFHYKTRLEMTNPNLYVDICYLLRKESSNRFISYMFLCFGSDVSPLYFWKAGRLQASFWSQGMPSGGWDVWKGQRRCLWGDWWCVFYWLLIY